MKTPPFVNAVVLGIFAAGALCAQDASKPAAGAPPASEKPAATSTGKPSQEELETKFKEAMTNVTMTGRWCPIKDGALGEEKEDKYAIVGARKVRGDAWLIEARMKYQGKEFVAPIPVKVQWAGDTAVIIVDKLAIPNGGVYSARVLVYDNTYAGTWSGGDGGGLLSGIMVKEKDAKPAEAAPKPSPEAK